MNLKLLIWALWIKYSKVYIVERVRKCLINYNKYILKFLNIK
jgi:hypothetical protein